MLEPRRIEMNIQPNKIETLGDGTYYYNYDIKSRVVSVQDMSDKKPHDETMYNFVQVHLAGQPDYKEIIRAVIREHVTQDEEFDLINSSNRVVLGLSDATSDRQKYLEYLEVVEVIKQKVRADFNIA